MAITTFRRMAYLAAGWVLPLTALVTLSGCAQQYTYSADYHDNTYFKVPYGWHQLRQDDLANELKAAGWPSAATWTSAFDAGTAPTASNFMSFGASAPFVFAQVGTLTQAASDGLSYDSLVDAFLPVSTTIRSHLPTGYLLSNFKLVSQQRVTGQQGIHGVEETYTWTFRGLITDTFEQVALTNADATQIYLLVAHCTNSCFAENQKAIDDVISSFTIRSPG